MQEASGLSKLGAPVSGKERAGPLPKAGAGDTARSHGQEIAGFFLHGPAVKGGAHTQTPFNRVFQVADGPCRPFGPDFSMPTSIHHNAVNDCSAIICPGNMMKWDL